MLTLGTGEQIDVQNSDQNVKYRLCFAINYPAVSLPPELRFK